ncbi:MFS transporter, partial [Burkholderia multivorans]|uniref:MFS transporter n=1 Tax=Burkholderia multivorans TaxID=87883 RepID=UPI002160B6C4
ATSYLLSSVLTVPIFGRLGDYYGRKPFVSASIVVFSGASVLCGMANDMLYLVLARGLQGIGGGMLVGTAFAIPNAELISTCQRSRTTESGNKSGMHANAV